MSATPWTGTWTEVDDSLAAHDDLVLALEARRGCPADAIVEELDAVDEHFDVDAVYVEPD